VPQIVESAEEYIVDDPVLAVIFKFEEKFVPGRRNVFHEGSSKGRLLDALIFTTKVSHQLRLSFRGHRRRFHFNKDKWRRCLDGKK
jgi:hypothetical protein